MEFPVRKNIRLKGYDYGSMGGYFVTVCTKNKQHYFGTIIDNKMELNELGNICENELKITMQKYRDFVDLHEYVIMPNHVHLLIIFANTTKTKYEHIKLGNVVGAWKSGTTKHIHKKGFDFERQSRFNDNIIRDQQSYDQIKYYIQTNPEKRLNDCHYG